MEIQKTLNSQSNLEKEEWSWRNQPARLQALLQSHSHQDSMVLAQRQASSSWSPTPLVPHIHSTNVYVSAKHQSGCWNASVNRQTSLPTLSLYSSSF